MFRKASLTSMLLVGVTVAGVIVVAVFFVWRAGEARVYELETPTSGEAPISIPAYEASETPDRVTSEVRVGSFKPPEKVPEYEIIEEKPADTEDARAVRILVDTPAREKAEYVLITRDIKARYADYDAVSIEFTDTEDLLDYNGAALIFNTPEGALYMGFVYGPPNNQGYYVRAAD